MKKAIKVSLVLAVVLVLAACGPTLTRDAYRGLVISQQSYDVALKGIASLYKEGKVDDGVKAEAIKLGKGYKIAHNGVVDALATYEEQGGEANKQAYFIAAQKASEALATLVTYARPYLEKYGKEVP